MILIAYFSHSGNTEVIAKDIHERLGGKLFRIRAVDPYPADYSTVVDVARKEQRSDARPKLAQPIDGIAPYDVVYLGYPNWWGTRLGTMNSTIRGESEIPIGQIRPEEGCASRFGLDRSFHNLKGCMTYGTDKYWKNRAPGGTERFWSFADSADLKTGCGVSSPEGI